MNTRCHQTLTTACIAIRDLPASVLCLQHTLRIKIKSVIGDFFFFQQAGQTLTTATKTRNQNMLLFADGTGGDTRERE